MAVLDNSKLLRQCGNKSNAHSHASLGHYDLCVGFERHSFFRQTNLDNGSNRERADCVYVATFLRYVSGSPTNLCLRLGFDDVHSSGKRKSQVAAALRLTTLNSVCSRSVVAISSSRFRHYQIPFSTVAGTDIPIDCWLARLNSGSKPETASSRSCALEACSG